MHSETLSSSPNIPGATVSLRMSQHYLTKCLRHSPLECTRGSHQKLCLITSCVFLSHLRKINLVYFYWNRFTYKIVFVGGVKTLVHLYPYYSYSAVLFFFPHVSYYGLFSTPLLLK